MPPLIEAFLAGLDPGLGTGRSPRMAERVFVSIGSNMGSRAANCRRAVEELTASGVEVVRESSLYETEPWGVTNQPPFINAVIEVATTLPPRDLLGLLKEIEKRIGRTPSPQRWGPRLIDLDILLYGSRVIDEEGLRVPHGFLHERAFVLAPMAEIAPEVVHPLLGKSISALLTDLGGPPLVKKLGPLRP